jgi:chromosome segregation ATPase
MDALHKSHVELQQRLEQLTANKRSLENEHKQMKHQLSATLSKLNSVQDEQTLIQAQVQTMKSALDQLPAKVESNSQTQFEELCQTNAELIGHNLSLEDKLQKAENTLIEFKMNYAQSENEKEMLQRKLFELKKLMRF